MWSQPIGLQLFVNTKEESGSGYTLYVFTVHTGEGGSARPLITVGGDEVPAPRLLYLEEPRGAAWDEDSNSGGLGPELLHL